MLLLHPPFRLFPCRLARTGFSLLELLVTMTVVSVLAALGWSGYGAIRRSVDRSEGMGQMRAIGVAIRHFGSENSGRFPGPMWPGQMPMIDPARDGRLARDLAPYLGAQVPEAPELSPIFVPPAYRRMMGEAFLGQARTYVLNMEVPLENGTIINPWGSLTIPDSRPLSQSAAPGQAWAMADADQQNPRVRQAAWKASTPPEPVHGRERNVLHFDGRVTSEETAYLESPPR